MKEYVNTFLHYRFLLGELVKKGIKLKYRRSYLGIIWSLLEPLLTMIVLTIVFGTLFGNKDRTFPVYDLTDRAGSGRSSTWCGADTLYAPDPDRADPGISVVLWLWNDPCYDWRFFQRYGISLVCSTYAGYVYMCDFLLS